MPLITITGHPCSGKTTRARQLKVALDSKIENLSAAYKVVHISDESLGIEKEAYRERDTEKAARGAQITAVKKHLSKSTIVILDNMTYIKGFRYQLFCEAKALTTNHCVVHVGAPVDVCRQWNKERGDKGWPDDLFEALVFRYEEPNPMTRWDSPLFSIAAEDTELPVEELWDSLISRKPKPPNQATVLKPATSGSYVTELDRITSSIVSELIDLHRLNPGGVVKLRDYSEDVELPLRLSIPELHRLRRTFVGINNMKPMDISRIRPYFIQYVIRNWELSN
jgi:protein KTI12